MMRGNNVELKKKVGRSPFDHLASAVVQSVTVCVAPSM